MPSTSEILDTIVLAVRDMTALALGWHVVIVIVAIAMLRGWRPGAAFGSWFLITPAVSVFVVSVMYASWFNAASFFALALSLTAFTREYDTPWRVSTSRWSVSLGCALVVYAFVYPHFIDGPWYRAFYAAPTGVVPCPTLALLAGFTLITGAHGSLAIPALLAIWATFYGLFGILKLGVVLDVGLLVATFGLGALLGRDVRSRSRYPGRAHALPR